MPHYLFRGNGSFITNGYTVFDGADAPAPPNFIAVKRAWHGSSLTSVNKKSSSSYNVFIKYLRDLAKKEAKKEKAYLTKKFTDMKDRFKKNGMEPVYFKELQAAIKIGDYNSAFTIIRRNQDELKKMIADTEQNKRLLSKTSPFFDRTAEAVTRKAAAECFDKMKKVFETTGAIPTLTVKELVDKIWKDIGAEVAGFYTSSQDKNKFQEALMEQLKKKGYLPKRAKSTHDLFYEKGLGRKNNLMGKIVKHLSKGGRSSIHGFTKQMFDGLYLGIFTELMSSVDAMRYTDVKGAATFNTGGFTERGRQQKNDLVTFEVFSAEIELNKVIENVMDQNGMQNGVTTLKQLDDIRKALQEVADQELFEIVENVKGYKSVKLNLQIAGSASVLTRGAQLKELKGKGILGPQMEGNIDQLVFYLNNIAKGCIMHKYQDRIAQYIAAICVMWMWSDYSDMFDFKQLSSNRKVVHLFNTGFVYATASSIINETANKLEAMANKQDSLGFARVSLSPPTITAADYEAQEKKHPYKGTESFAEGQNILAQRWGAIKKQAQTGGKVAISFNQQQLDELLSTLKNIIQT